MRLDPDKMVSPAQREILRAEKRQKEREQVLEHLRLKAEERMAIRALAGTTGGRVWIDRWTQEVNTMRAGLVTVDPEDSKRIVALQTRIKDREAWLRILNGTEEESDAG